MVYNRKIVASLGCWIVFGDGGALIVCETVAFVLEANNILDIANLALEEHSALVQPVGVALSTRYLLKDLAHTGHH